MILLLGVSLMILGIAIFAVAVNPQRDEVDERRVWAHQAIDQLQIASLDIKGWRLPDGRTEVRIEVVGFEDPAPWLQRHFREHPGMADVDPATIHHPVTPP